MVLAIGLLKWNRFLYTRKNYLRPCVAVILPGNDCVIPGNIDFRNGPSPCVVLVYTGFIGHLENQIELPAWPEVIAGISVHISG